MRISDWSSDVCSSDLRDDAPPVVGDDALHGADARDAAGHGERDGLRDPVDVRESASGAQVFFAHRHHERGRRAAESGKDRKGVVKGKGVSVRVDLGGRRINKKNKNKEITNKNT